MDHKVEAALSAAQGFADEDAQFCKNIGQVHEIMHALPLTLHALQTFWHACARCFVSCIFLRTANEQRWWNLGTFQWLFINGAPSNDCPSMEPIQIIVSLQHGLSLIQEISTKKRGEPVNILTHCNAGWLAFVDNGSATAPIYAAHDSGIKVRVCLCLCAYLPQSVLYIRLNIIQILQ